MDKIIVSSNAISENAIVDTNFISTMIKEFPEQALRLGIRVVLAFVFLFIGTQVIRLIRKIVRKSLKRATTDVGVIQFLDSLIKVLLYLVLVFMIAGSFGLDAASIVAVLGSAGVAIGLALQGSLSNLAGGVLILLLKPFRVGDYIIEDNKKNEGTVEEIQLFYTKLRTADDRIVVLPNGTLANNSLTNTTTTPSRRLDLFVGISYQANLQQAKDIIFSLLEQEEFVMKDEEYNVFVEKLGNSEVLLGLRCMVMNEHYFVTKWNLLEKIKYSFDEAGIEIPFQQLDVRMR